MVDADPAKTTLLNAIIMVIILLVLVAIAISILT